MLRLAHPAQRAAGDVKCRAIRIFQYAEDINVLVRRQYLRCRKDGRSMSYYFTSEVIDALKQNRPYEPPSLRVEDADALFADMEEIFDRQSDDELDYDGVCRELVPVETVQLRVCHNQQPYFRALPLHRSQREVETTDDHAVFEYRLRPTYDFQQEILSHGGDVEVLAPAWLREEIKGKLKQAAELYR